MGLREKMVERVASYLPSSVGRHLSGAYHPRYGPSLHGQRARLPLRRRWEPETDLLAGTPDWFEDVFERRVPTGEAWFGFVYGFWDGSWRRAEYDLNDGFTSVNNPAMSVEAALKWITSSATENANAQATDPESVSALLGAGADVTEEQLAAVFGSISVELSAGVAAARRFLPDAVAQP